MNNGFLPNPTSMMNGPSSFVRFLGPIKSFFQNSKKPSSSLVLFPSSLPPYSIKKFTFSVNFPTTTRLRAPWGFLCWLRGINCRPSWSSPLLGGGVWHRPKCRKGLMPPHPLTFWLHPPPVSSNPWHFAQNTPKPGHYIGQLPVACKFIHPTSRSQEFRKIWSIYTYTHP